MAIVEMQRIGIYGLKKDRKKVLEFLQGTGAVEVAISESADELFDKMDTAGDKVRYQKIADDFEHAIELLKKYDTKRQKALLNLENKLILKSEWDEVISQRQKLYSQMNRVLALEKSISESEATIIRKENKIASIKPWQSLDIPLNSEKTKTTKIFIGSFPMLLTEEQLINIAVKDMEDEQPVTVKLLGVDNQVSNVCVIAHNSIADKVEENMRSEGYIKLPYLTHRVPELAIEKRRKEIKAEEEKIKGYKKELDSMTHNIETFKVAADYFRTRSEKYRILGTIPQSKNAFFIEGWVEKEKADAIKNALEEKYDVVVEYEEISEEEVQNEPVVLKNNKFSACTEGVLESYGLPQHGRVDPTTVMSIFYVFFFGMMLSDAGYGLVMSIICAVVLIKHKRIATGLKKMIQLFFWCGLSTTFWGFMYGGFFGDAIDVIAHTFFGVPATEQVLKPIWFAPLENPMKLLIYCMLFGLIHLYAGLAMKGYEYLKNHDVIGFVSDIISWYLFITGLVLMLLPSSIFASIAGRQIVFAPALVTASKVITIAGLAIILLMSGRANKNWGLRIALGAYDIYGVTGWLSDVLSYSRLLALGLATGVIANVINMMASMNGNSPVGAVIFIVVFILGHTLNILINLLGAYVHTNRLQYVEFFGKFYDGGGKPFEPFKTINRYVEIKED